MSPELISIIIDINSTYPLEDGKMKQIIRMNHWIQLYSVWLYCNQGTTVMYLKKGMNDFISRVAFIIIYSRKGETTIGAQESITHTV